MFKAQCLCGSNRMRVSEIEPRIAHCHCHMCQKFHGAAFSTFVEVKLENLDWPNEYCTLSEYLAENQSKRSFCTLCGSSLAFESKFNRQSNTIEISLAAFDQSSQLKLVEITQSHSGDNIAKSASSSSSSSTIKQKVPLPTSIVDCHIYVESKAPWLELDDNLPKFKRYRE